MSESQPDFEKMSFEEAMTELEGIVRKLENGQSSLESSIEDYTRGTKLKSHCETKLKEASLKVDKIVSHGDGQVETEAFESEA